VDKAEKVERSTANGTRTKQKKIRTKAASEPSKNSSTALTRMKKHVIEPTPKLEIILQIEKENRSSENGDGQ